MTITQKEGITTYTVKKPQGDISQESMDLTNILFMIFMIIATQIALHGTIHEPKAFNVFLIQYAISACATLFWHIVLEEKKEIPKRKFKYIGKSV